MYTYLNIFLLFSLSFIILYFTHEGHKETLCNYVGYCLVIPSPRWTGLLRAYNVAGDEKKDIQTEICKYVCIYIYVYYINANPTGIITDAFCKAQKKTRSRLCLILMHFSHLSSVFFMTVWRIPNSTCRPNLLIHHIRCSFTKFQYA